MFEKCADLFFKCPGRNCARIRQACMNGEVCFRKQRWGQVKGRPSHYSFNGVEYPFRTVEYSFKQVEYSFWWEIRASQGSIRLSKCKFSVVKSLRLYRLVLHNIYLTATPVKFLVSFILHPFPPL